MNENQETVDGLETQSNETETTDVSAPGREGQQEVIDLDALTSKVRFQGKDWDPKDLRSGFMFQSDYSKKTAALAQERQRVESEKRFADNFAADVRKVIQNPNLIQEFKSVYSKGWHALLDQYLEQARSTGQVPNQTQNQQAASANPAYEQRLNQIESNIREAQVEATSAAIDSIFTKMSQKYPMADEEMVIARAQALIDKGAKLTDERGNQIESAWDKIWKSVNDNTQKRFDGHYKKQVDNQRSANVRARDTATGGGIPGQAPKKMTIKEATEHAIATLTNRQE